jgi:DNA-binding transcriptional MerR regulator
MNGNRRALRSGEVAEMSGVSPDTIRYYERLGILPHASRTASGYRMYTPSRLSV